MAINYYLLHEGDLFFTAPKDWLGRLIRFFSRGNVSHVGQLIKPYGGKLLYKAEMSYNFWDKKSDFQINPIKENEIFSIKRPLGLYLDEDSRQRFRTGCLKWHEQTTLKYDIKELIEGIKIVLGLKATDKDKYKMICSRAVYERMKLDGFPVNKYYEQYVTPDNLYDNPLFVEVSGWKE